MVFAQIVALIVLGINTALFCATRAIGATPQIRNMGTAFIVMQLIAVAAVVIK